MNDIKYGKITEFIHFLIRGSYEGIENLVAVDATAGNGFDTAFLCDLCHSNGFVYAFDVQKEAIDNTEKLLNEKKLSNYKLILDTHDNIDKYISGTNSISCKSENKLLSKGIDICIFNLGYLPKSDKSIKTEYHTSINAIKKAIALLNKNGRIYIAAYINHDHGEEASHILECISQLDKRKFNVLTIKIVNKENCPPEIYIIERKDA